MKDGFIEMLMRLFEKSLSQLKTKQADGQNASEKNIAQAEDSNTQVKVYRAPSNQAMRIFTYEEQIKLSKSSYQFIVRLSKLGIIAPEALEMVIHHLMLSDSRRIGLEETKWTLRDILGEDLDYNQLAFLDLLLYQKEDQRTSH